jgi:hypothetical protein
MESKSELFDRLRREGRWAEASRFKDEAIKEFRSKGMGRAEANKQAWEAMAEKFPPLPAAQQIPESAATAPDAGPSGSQTAAANNRGLNSHSTPAAPAGPDEDVDALLDRIGDGQPPDLVRDTLWAYQNLENRKAKPGDAPSLGAWSLLQWARQYRNRFFEQVLPKAMANKPPEDEENIRRERKSIAEIRGILEKFNQGWEEELLADIPAAVREKIRGILDCWAGRFGLNLDDAARLDLEAHLSRLVQDCIETIGRTPGGVR